MPGSRKARVTASTEEQEAAILRAAAREFTDVGVRQANMDSIAKTAGVSRSTLYRRFPNKDNLLIALANHTFERGMADLERTVEGLSPADAVVEAFARGAEMIENDPLLNRMVVQDAEIRGLTSAMSGLFIDMVTDRVAGSLRKAGATMADDLLHRAVEIHVRLVISYLEIPASDESQRTPEAVREFAATFLAPMIH
ncbi:TetR/AcrR family transcriptional regulator [Gordonia sp. PP30]|uniref:TetR/AcrR family transcriptional regulator n=1 Tax=unclassified Gordonia (in: high G+C Gram-positive bacteria) TaxID=2657482 RepID=UPI001FFFE3EF|nr:MULTISPECIES: TetR/AcrR family transcriptional regulator [unclassified Gordonia (in: high G+C Gram-positive bacteria)]UQE74477.1 TetR/AcrR family transcriptional regulator [Gordonia sp. PP30]